MDIRMQSYILLGGTASAEAAAVQMAKELLCSRRGKHGSTGCDVCRRIEQGIHPDVIYVRPGTDSKGAERSEILVDQVRALMADAPVYPIEAERKVYIFPRAVMNTSAQNAFLKLLEEPPSFVTFLLCIENRGQLLETVRSRCGEIRVGAQEHVLSSNSVEAAEAYLRARGDCGELALLCSSWEKLSRDELLEILFAVERRIVRTMPGEMETPVLIDFCRTAEKYLKANVSPKNVACWMATYVYEKK